MQAVHKYRAGVMFAKDGRLVVTTETQAVSVSSLGLASSSGAAFLRPRGLIGILTRGNTINILTSSGVPIIRPGLQGSVSPHLYRCFTNRFPDNWAAMLMKHVGILAIDTDLPFKP